MDSWDKEKQKFIEKLEQQEKCFEELFSKDKDSMIIGSSERSTLQELRQRNSAVLSRLKSREFAVSVVGLEKAGKSTLGNALINSELLPEYTERCTYTTTELRSGDNNEAEITFYSEEEFSRIFREMLQSVGYGGEADFRTLSPETFARYWEAVSEDPSKLPIYERHNGKTDEDILTILRGSSTIAGLLGQPVKKFAYDSKQGSDDFQLYITGISSYDSRGAAVRTAHPYAVKNVVIHSTELGGMSNIVLYDVPGFDSTTELHKKQTEQMLKEADAIILVTNVGDRPNINSPQLDMLRKVRDQDGVKLRDKTFIFGNKIDMAGNKTRAQDNDSALRNEAERYQIAQGSRVISGSAKAYLEGLGLMSPDEKRRGRINAKSKLDEWGMTDGITQLRSQLQDYYDNDRFEVLRRRAETTITETVEFLRTLLAKYSPDVLSRLDTGGKYLLAMSRKADVFVKEANTISGTFSRQITSERPFSSQLSENIAAIYPLTEELQSQISEIIRGVSVDPDAVDQITEVNVEIRRAIRIMFMKNLKREASAIVENKQGEIRAELVRRFLEVMGMKQGSEYEKELTDSVNKLFDSYLVKGEEKCLFNTLIERFASGLIDTLIRSPFGSVERLNRIRATLPELFSMAVYYSMPEKDGSFEVRDSEEERRMFFAKILAHDGLRTGTKDSSLSTAAGEVLSNYFSMNSDSLGLTPDELPIDEWALMFSEKGEKLSAMPKELAKSLEAKFYRAGWEKFSSQKRIDFISQSISEYLNSSAGTRDISLGTMLEEFHAKASDAGARTLDDVLRILDEDITILRDLTAKSVIRATGLEHAFIAVITNNINLIRNSIKDAEDARFSEWIDSNVRKVLDSEFAAIDRDNMNSQTRRSIIAAINQVLSNME